MVDAPPPPPNPFDTNGQDTSQDFSNGSSDGLTPNAPNVAAKPGKALMVVVLVGGAVLFLLYNIMFGGTKEKPKPPPKEIPVANQTIPPIQPPVVVEPTTLPQPPVLLPPTLPRGLELPTSMKDIKINPLTPEQDAAAKAQVAARMKSNMLIMDETGKSSGISNPFGSSNTSSSSGNSNATFAAQAENAKVETVTATRLKNLSHTIAQGRVIHATMETALNTDLSAPIRAIVSRDTYGEAGDAPLVPKGSRLIGQYNTVIANGQNRVYVIWTRLIRPDGVDVMIGSPLVDGIGQAGVTGQVDSKFQEIFARAVLSSVMNIALAIGSEKLSDNTQTTTSGSGTTQTTGGAAGEATTNALNRLGSITDGFIQRFMGVQPTILVDQGTVVNVMVNKDLIFPSTTTDAEIVE